jgi:hypothetical protein
VDIWKLKEACLEVKVVKGSYGRLRLPEVKGQMI